MEHTPGPWSVTFKRFNEVRATNGALVAECYKLTGLVNVYANARLVAAAPDLLDALQGVLRVADQKNDEFDAAYAAIAKAVSDA